MVFIFQSLLKDKTMTAEEVKKFIDGHPKWTLDEKLGVHSLYKAYVSMSRYPKESDAGKQAESFRQQLLQRGIRV